MIHVKVTPNRPDALGVRGIARDLAARGLGTLKPLNIPQIAGEFDCPVVVQIDPVLKEKGQVFVGIDVIGDWLTEINVTSPTGIQELERFDGTNTAERIWQVIEAKRGL